MHLFLSIAISLLPLSALTRNETENTPQLKDLNYRYTMMVLWN